PAQPDVVQMKILLDGPARDRNVHTVEVRDGANREHPSDQQPTHSPVEWIQHGFTLLPAGCRLSRGKSPRVRIACPNGAGLRRTGASLRTPKSNRARLRGAIRAVWIAAVRIRGLPAF